MALKKAFYKKINKPEFIRMFRKYEGMYTDKGLSYLYDYLDNFYADKDFIVDPDKMGFSEIHLSEIKERTGYENIEELEKNMEIIRIDDKKIIYFWD